MRYLKLAGISAIAFLAIFTCIGLLLPGRIHVVRAIVIDKEPVTVLGAMKNTATWSSWYPFLEDGGKVEAPDQDSSIFRRDDEYIVLFQKHSDSNSVRFINQSGSGGSSVNIISMLPVSGSLGQTQVLWDETEQLHWYPWERFRGLVLEKAKNEYLDTALHRFKNYMDTVK